MELHSLVAQVQEQLTVAAGLGDERTQQTAMALARAAEPAVRLAILAALSAAADEITAALLDSPGSPAVSIRLDGDDLGIEVRTTEAAPPRADDGDTSARISLRLSEALKSDVEQAASRDGVSVNTWLVRAASAALTPGWTAGPGHGPNSGRRSGNQAHRVTGWING